MVMKQGGLQPQYHGIRADDQVASYRKVGVAFGWKNVVDLEHLLVRVDRDNIQIFIHEQLTGRK